MKTKVKKPFQKRVAPQRLFLFYPAFAEPILRNGCMAKKSSVAKNEKRMNLANKYYARRMELKKIILSPESSYEERLVAGEKLRKFPRDANPIRVQSRCSITGRPRAVYRKFGISRITLREMASNGLIPGMTKASW
jgi:small subunit ribosomal protein S14